MLILIMGLIVRVPTPKWGLEFSRNFHYSLDSRQTLKDVHIASPLIPSPNCYSPLTQPSPGTVLKYLGIFQAGFGNWLNFRFYCHLK